MNSTENNISQNGTHFKKSVLEELQSITFPKNKTRLNIKGSQSTTSFVLGDVNYRGQKYLNGRTRGPSKWNIKFPKLYERIQQLISLCKPDFEYTTIQVNKNVECQPHIDKNNVGNSYIIGLGNYTGGELIIENKYFNIKNRWKKFDGHCAHWVAPFKGDRYTLYSYIQTTQQNINESQYNKEWNI